MGAKMGDPQNGCKSRYSVWPPSAAPANSSQELKGYSFVQYLICKVLDGTDSNYDVIFYFILFIFY